MTLFFGLYVMLTSSSNSQRSVTAPLTLLMIRPFSLTSMKATLLVASLPLWTMNVFRHIWRDGTGFKSMSLASCEHKCSSFKQSYYGREPWSTSYGRRLVFQKLWVQIPAHYAGWTFSHFVVVVRIGMFVWKDKNKQKETEDGPFKKQFY